MSLPIIIKYIAFIVGFVGGFFIGIGIVAGLELFYMTLRTLRLDLNILKNLKNVKEILVVVCHKYLIGAGVLLSGGTDDAYVEDHICEPYFRKYAKWNV